MKILFLSIILSAMAIASNAQAISVSVYKQRLGLKETANSVVRVSNQDILYADTRIMRATRGRRAINCKNVRTNTKWCRIRSSMDSKIDHLILDSDNNIIFDNGEIEVLCGRVKKGIFGRSVRLNKKCVLKTKIEYKTVVTNGPIHRRTVKEKTASINFIVN